MLKANLTPSCFLHIDGIISYLGKYGAQQILGWNLRQKIMNGKYFEKLHIKTVIST